jgi:hypothetical protein
MKNKPISTVSGILTAHHQQMRNYTGKRKNGRRQQNT